MNKDIRNLGTAIAISVLTEGLSLAKIYLPMVHRYVYAISNKNGEISYTVDIEKNENNLDSDEMLQNILNYANKELDGSEELKFGNAKETRESIAKVINAFRSKTEKIFREYRDIKDEKERLAHPNKVILQNILKRIGYVDNDLYTFSEVNSKEYGVLNLSLELLDFICGEYGLDAETLNTCADDEDIEEIYKDHNRFMNELEDYLKDKNTESSLEPEASFMNAIRRMMELSDRFETEQDLPWNNENQDDTEDEENDYYDYSDDEYPDYEDDMEDYMEDDMEDFDEDEFSDFDDEEIFLIKTIMKNYGIKSLDFLMKLTDKAYFKFGNNRDMSTEDKLKLLIHILQGDELEDYDDEDGKEPADND